MNIVKLLRRAALALSLLLPGPALLAQNPLFFVEDAVAVPGEEVEVNIRVRDAGEIVSVQLTAQWDTLELEYLGVSNVYRQGTLEDNFNQTEVDTGRLGFLYFDMGLQNLDLPDSTVLFTLRFTPVDGGNFVARVGFGERPFVARAATSEGERVMVDTRPGTVSFGSLSATDVVAEDERLTARPNPFGDRVRLRLATNGPGGEALLEVLTLDGRSVLRRPLTLAPGRADFELTAADLPAAGTYLVRLTTGREQYYRKVVHQR